MERKSEARGQGRCLTRHHVPCLSLRPTSGAGAPVLGRCCAGTSLAHRPAHQCPDFVVVVMDFLKSAVASAISKGPAFGYTFGDRVDLNDSIWTLHNGTKRVWPGRLHAHAHLLANLGASGRRLQM